MTNLKKSALTELMLLIDQLKNEGKILNYDEFISVLNEMKSLCTNKSFIDMVTQSLKVLDQTQIKSNNSLTNREKEILELIGRGYKNTIIADQLSLSTSTVETHRKNIRKKLNLKGNNNLFVYALLFNLQNQHLITDDNS